MFDKIQYMYSVQCTHKHVYKCSKSVIETGIKTPSSEGWNFDILCVAQNDFIPLNAHEYLNELDNGPKCTHIHIPSYTVSSMEFCTFNEISLIFHDTHWIMNCVSFLV